MNYSTKIDPADTLENVSFSGGGTLSSKLGISFLGALVGIAAGPKSSHAALLPDSVAGPNGTLNDQGYQNLGTAMSGKYLVSFETPAPSLGGTILASGTIWNSEYVITAAHAVVPFEQYATSYQVETGDNVKSDPGTTIQVSSILVYPGYDGTRNTPDIAILKLASPLPGVTSSVIGTISDGSVASESGFGITGTPATGYQTVRDDEARGWNATVDTDGFIPGGSAEYYQEDDFGLAIDMVSLNGRGASGDSGGPVVNSLGQLVGVGTAEVGSDTDTLGNTIFLNLSQPDVNAWIQENTIQAPEPGSFLILVGALGSGLFARRRRQP